MKKVTELIHKLSFLSLPLCFFSFVFLDYAFRFFYRFVGETRLLSWKAAVFTLSWSLLLTGLIALLPRLFRRIAMMVCILFFALLAVVHGAMYKIFGHLFSFADMNFAQDGAKFFSWSYLDLRKAFLLCVVGAVLIMVAAVILVPKPEPGAPQWKKRLVALGVAAISVAPIVCLHNAFLPREGAMWWGSTYDGSAEGEVYRTFTDSNRCVPMVGLYQYTLRNFLVSYGLDGDFQSVEKLDEFYEARREAISGDNEMTGALQDKNLIMIMLESIDTWLATPDYMPRLYALQQESVDFTRFYTPLFLSAATFNTEIISQTGLIPASSGLPSSAYSTNQFPLSLPSLFRKAGYTANSFHSASPDIYSRGSVHTNLGFEAYNNSGPMKMDNYMLDSQMMGGYELMVGEGKTFSYIITYSGHGPYTDEMSVISDPHYEKAKAAVEKSGVTASAENKEEYVLAVAHAMETDEFIGQLIDRMEQEGRLENTALLFYGDHYGKYMTDKEFLCELKGIPGNSVDLYNTPCFLYGGGLAPRKVDKPASSLDLAPTIVNLYELPGDRRYYVGDDIFGDKGGNLIFPNGNWYDGEAYHSVTDASSMPLEEQAISQDALERYNASIDTLKSDYFKYREMEE